MSSIRPSKIIEVFADVVCSFTHVGLRRLVDYRRQMQCSPTTPKVKPEG